MEIRRRSTIFRLLLSACLFLLLMKVSLVLVEPLCRIMGRKCNVVKEETGYDDYDLFLMTKKEAERFDLQQIHKLLNGDFHFNTTKINDIKSQISKVSNPSMLFASRGNMANAKRIKFALEEVPIRKIPSDMFNFLPHEQHLSFGRPTVCSVVGSSGILNNSSCGRQIDNADFVIRFNLPPLNGHRKDVGSRSDITTLNPSQIGKQFGGFVFFKDRQRFLKHVQQYNHYIWASAFAHPNTMETCRRLLITTRSRLKHLKILFGNPNHWRSMSTFWHTRGVNVKKHLSSGIYWVTNALSFCSEVHLYGFWPFALNWADQPVRYHYYANEWPTTGSSKTHGFGDEFYALLQMHKQGILQIHTNCDS
ncbi:alpha-N-acetylneuraminide alpha-2,8-sialyltransferase-like [Antedon mediterranea]|uniref:alpha-N-acetylneuraminide alpha-2,8-sialyltransferase-like n=1 Tax=Antedon mediterranea TaxID=105859 RepID=UPI003AF634D2